MRMTTRLAREGLPGSPDTVRKQQVIVSRDAVRNPQKWPRIDPPSARSDSEVMNAPRYPTFHDPRAPRTRQTRVTTG